MSLKVPEEIISIHAKISEPFSPMDEMALASQLNTAIMAREHLSLEERKGVFAEIEAFQFQRARDEEKSPWGIYWSDLSSGVTIDGKEFHFPDLFHVDEEIVSYWIARAQSSKHPVLIARYADLAWEIGIYLKQKNKRGAGKTSQSVNSLDIPVLLAQKAIDAYLEVIDKSLYSDEYYAWEMLDRAIGLTISIKDSLRRKKAKSTLFDLYRKLNQLSTRFMWWRFDDLNWEHAKSLELDASEQQAIITSLEKTLAISADIANLDFFNPHDATSAADRLVRRMNKTNELDKAKKAIQSAALAFEAAAKNAGGLTAIAWLENLIPRYRDIGLVDDAARVEATIRSRAKEAQGEMQRFEVPINIPKKELDEWVEKVAGKSLDEALSNIALACFIKEDSTQSSLQLLSKNAPLFSFMPSVVMGIDGFTVAKVGSIESDLDGRSLQHAATLFSWYAPWLYFAFNHIKEKYALDVENIVSALRECTFFPIEHESLLKEGLVAWLADDSVKCIHILVPQIETALRNLLAALGALVMKSDPDTGGFQVIGLGKILNHQSFRNHVPNDFRFHLKALYSDSRGINLRNDIAHGLVRHELLNMGLANWVVHSLLLIGTLRIRPVQQGGNS